MSWMRYAKQVVILFACVTLQYTTVIYQDPIRSIIDSGLSYGKHLYEAISIFEGSEAEVKFEKDPVYHGNVKSKRPDNLEYRIGDIVINWKDDYIGVIIGWNIPDEKEDPSYLILSVNRKDKTYDKVEVGQKNVILLNYIQMNHPEIDKYFMAFNGVHYTPQPWLRLLYPAD